jgi:hypothetical protein
MIFHMTPHQLLAPLMSHQNTISVAGDVLINLGPDSTLVAGTTADSPQPASASAAAGSASAEIGTSSSSSSLASAAGPSSSTYVRGGSGRSLMQGLGSSSTGSQGLLNQQQQQQQQQYVRHQKQHASMPHASAGVSQQQDTPAAAAAAAAAPAAAPSAAPSASSPTAGVTLEHLPRFSSQHIWLHEQSADAEQQTTGRLQGLANAVGAVMHGLLGSTAVSGPQAASQIAYPLDKEAVDSGSESGSPTRQSLLRHNLSRFSGSSSGSSSGSGSGSPLISGAGGFGSNAVGRPSLFAPGLTRGGSSSNAGSDVQKQRSKSCSAAGSAWQQQQQQGEAEGGEGSGPDGGSRIASASGFQRSKKRWQSAAANVMQMKKVRASGAEFCIITFAMFRTHGW